MGQRSLSSMFICIVQAYVHMHLGKSTHAAAMCGQEVASGHGWLGGCAACERWPGSSNASLPGHPPVTSR